ncbi:hypothetical protein J3458_005282 [Metarhizium acridum]|uniref:uncharacterized protein n=1 Tax=Metarhizium acridum TaxID=92637 RepID=UPI001C6B1BCF|nr:hypothetical protein J3458_005282 [Metarhizium acridum]
MMEKNTLFVRLADNAMIMSTLRTVNDKTECVTAQMTKKKRTTKLMTRPRMAVVIVRLRIGSSKMHTANQPSLKCRPQSVSRLSFAESVSFRCEIVVARLAFT